MILNLLATMLILGILGVILLLAAYVTSLVILLFVPWTQAYLVFAHWLRLQNPARLLTPEAYTLRPFSTRNIRISTPDGLSLGAWHILPPNTPRLTLERIHALKSRLSSIVDDSSKSADITDNDHAANMERKAEMIYEDALRKAEKVVLYFHGQVGDRGKSNRVATYKGIQSALPSAHVIAMDCRGYGDSDGFPSEIGFKIDALAAWTWITERVESRKIMIYGHSLGSGIATNLCLQLEDQNETPLALVLDAAFTSMPDMMTAYRKIPIVRPFARFPMLINHFKMRLTDRFETVRAVETIKSPLLLIHGEEDADVLISNSHTLFHTALTARRLQSCTKELAVTEAGEAAFEEDELAREGLELSFQQSGYSTGTTLGSAPGIHSDLVQRNSHRQQQQRQQQQKQKQNSLFMDGERSPTSFGEDSGIGSEVTSGTSSTFATSPRHGSRGEKERPAPFCEEMSHASWNGGGVKEGEMLEGQQQSKTVQLDFPREGSLEYNQEYQIGFLTVQYAVHNTCMDFDLSRQVLGTFLRTVESRLVAKGLLATVSATSPKWGQSNTAPFMDDTESTAMSRTDSGATRENGLQGKEDAGNSYHSSEWEGEGEGEPAELDLARILCRDKIGYVDQSEVPEVVE